MRVPRPQIPEPTLEQLVNLLLILVGLLLLLGGFNLYKTYQGLGRADRAIASSAEARRAGSIAGARSFYLTCRDNRLPELERTREQHAKVDQSLRLLHLKDTPELRRVIERNYRRDLRRFSLTYCTDLPTVRRTELLYGVDVTPEDRLHERPR